MTNKDTGNMGEELAVQALEERGFNILERNWHFKYWEVDIIASRENRLHFVEVKTRTNQKFGYPEESITRDKMQSLKNAAEAYQEKHPEWKYIQFDVAAITLNGDKLREFLLIEDVYF
ncbi:MAG: YraN family protein [Chitinophagaceae bacterium]|nr:YraN family protein [Chitinophagaceae bacterium]